MGYNTEWQQGVEQSVTEQVFYDTVMYLPLDKIENLNNKTIKEIINAVKKLPKSDYDEDIVKTIEEIASKNKGYWDTEISNYSGSKEMGGYNPSAISGAVFTTQNGQCSVNFRGTPSGAWVDNGQGLSGVKNDKPYVDEKGNEWYYLSPIDIQTLEYFKKVKNDPNLKGQVDQFIVSGHSKGGHQAFLVSLLYADDISACYGFDGQSISPEMWQELKELYKDDPAMLQQIRDRIYAINVNNDYVHVLGWTEENGYIANNIYIIEGYADCNKNPGANHYIQAFFTGGKLNAIDLNGEGPLAQFLMKVSDKLMMYSPEDREAATNTLMWICQLALGKELPVNISTNDIIKALANMDKGLKITFDVIKDVLKDPAMRDMMAEYLKSVFDANDFQNKIMNALKWMIKHPVVSIAGIGLIISVVPVIIKLVAGIFTIINLAAKAVIMIQKLCAWLKLAAKNAIAKAKEIYNKAKEKAINAIKIAVDFAKKVKNAAVQTAKNVWEKTKQLIERASAAVRRTAAAMKSLFNRVVNAMKQIGQQVLDGVKSFVKDTISFAKQIGKATAKFVLDGVHKVGNAIKDGFTKVKNFVINTGEKIQNQIVTDVQKVKEFMVNQMTNVKNAVEKIIGIKKTVELGIVNIGSPVISAFSKVTGIIKNGIDKIKNVASNIVDNISHSVMNLSSWITEATAQAAKKLSDLKNFETSGTAGINYGALDQIIWMIRSYGNQAQSIEYAFDQMISQVLNLRYAHMDAGSFTHAKRTIAEQKWKMEQYSSSLNQYNIYCHELENRFVHELRSAI